MRKTYSRRIREARAAISGTKEWSRNSDVARHQQISYVIEMATAAIRHQIIKAEQRRADICGKYRGRPNRNRSKRF